MSISFFQSVDPTAEYRWRNTSVETSGLIDAVWAFGGSTQHTRPQVLAPHWKVCLAVERLWKPQHKGPADCRLKLLGPVSRPRINENPAGYELVAARINPERVLKAFGITPSDIADEEIEYTGFKGAHMLTALGEAGASAERVGAALIRVLVELAGEERATATTLAAARIREHRGNLAAPALCAEFGITSRTMRRQFVSELGVPPKYYARTVRLQSLLLRVDRMDKPNWSQIALAYGFFDQSHLCSEVRNMTGQTLTQLHAQRLGLRRLEVGARATLPEGV